MKHASNQWEPALKMAHDRVCNLALFSLVRNFIVQYRDNIARGTDVAARESAESVCVRFQDVIKSDAP